jgi:ornithine cyclodeaminase/alanine dehydrogenase-like protein (mu-crystallin family)
MNPAELPLIDAAELTRRLPMPRAVEALDKALRAGLDPEADHARSVLEVEAGQLLLMPSTAASYVGVKIAGVAPGNPSRGKPRIIASYLLMDAVTLAPVALIDGTALTSLRTPAVSAVAVDHLAVPEAGRLVVFGGGPQALGHIEACRAVRPLTSVGVVTRRREQASVLVEQCRELGVDAEEASPEAVRTADIVACCTTSRTPLFAAASLAPHAAVVAMGSHEPTAREVETELLHRATVVVDARAAALREAGDVLIPLRAGQVNAAVIAGNLSDLVCGALEIAPMRPRLFKSVGMAWQDLVVAAAAVEQP